MGEKPPPARFGDFIGHGTSCKVGHEIATSRGGRQLTEDGDRNANGTLKSWPQFVLEDKPSPTGRFAFTSWKLWKKGDPLVPSGLLGPVTMRACTIATPH